MILIRRTEKMMSIAALPSRHVIDKSVPSLPPLENGDRLDQATFHARYTAMPDHVRAELIEGVVYMASPVKTPHWRKHVGLIGWLAAYQLSTPGVEAMLDGTTILGDDSEPQPDGALRLLHGQSHETPDGCISGAPELICEISSSTESIDLHAKKRDYERHGAREYLVAAVRAGRVFWFVRGAEMQFVETPPDADGILRSRVFPGLWLDPAALLAGDLPRLMSVLGDGTRSAEHAALVERLNSAGDETAPK
jgi:Uma2 family endonuclease